MRRRIDARPENDDTTVLPIPRRAHRRRRGRDLIPWIALGLVVAVALVVTTDRSTVTRKEIAPPAHRVVPTTPAENHRAPHVITTASANMHPTTTQAAKVKTPVGHFVSPPTTTPAASQVVPTTSTTTLVRANPSPTPARIPKRETTTQQGALRYPDDVATTYPFSTMGGNVSVAAAWTGTANVTMTLVCRGARKSITGTFNSSITIHALPGTCAATLSAPTEAIATTFYRLNFTYESATTS